MDYKKVNSKTTKIPSNRVANQKRMRVTKMGDIKLHNGIPLVE